MFIQTLGYSADYSKKSFWDKVGNFAGKAGKKVVEKALILYFCLEDKDTPTEAKGIIIAALGYFIVPVDLVPDFILVFGYTDDLGALVVAFKTVVAHIKDEHKSKAKEQLEKWFGSDKNNDIKPT